VKFYKSFLLFSLLLSLASFVVGCGGASSVSFDSDPVMSDPENDPTLESNTDISGESTETGEPTETDQSDESGQPDKKQ
jgi:hypothetical protein